MTEVKQNSFYETLFKISEGNVELFKEETKGFLTAVAGHAGAAAQLKRAAVAPEVKPDATSEPVFVERSA